MGDDGDLVFFFAPDTRATASLTLLEELGAPYQLRVLDLQGGEQRRPAYLAVNPMGKVPAIRHGDAVVTEQVAIFLYLADRFPQAALAPPPGDPLRGPYLRWMVFHAACFEPAMIDRALKREPGLRKSSPYGDYDTMLATLLGQLARGPWLLGERFTAADVLWGTSLTWVTRFGLVPETPEVAPYIARFNARPAVARATARNAELAAAQQQASAGPA
ncbi:MAG: glutathione S-transferase family protein [Rhodospirillales bacterium]|nr:glutathione S-transferase family protein [Rhodospirillales bacterium]